MRSRPGSANQAWEPQAQLWVLLWVQLFQGPNLPLGLRGKAEGCTRVTAGPKRPHLGTPLRHGHRDLTSLAPHERLPEILVLPREKTPTGAAARGNP